MRKFFQMCAEIEQTLGTIYIEFARQCSSIPDLKAIWETLAGDEVDHSNQILMAGRLAPEHSRNISIEQAHRLKQVTAAILEEARNEDFSPGKCLELGLRLEEDFKCVHVQCAINFLDEKMAAMFRALASEDERHLRMIAEYCKKNGYSD